jgi:hypothetical protein
VAGGSAPGGAVAAGSGPDGTVPAGPAPAPSLAHRWLVAFGRFWWDFLVGDTPELLIGALIALGVVALLVKAFSLNAAAVALFPLMVAGLLWASVFHARPKR